MLFTILFAFGAVLAQQNKSEDKKVIKEVEEINKTSEEVNETADNTNNAIKSTIENSKETIKTIGSLFGSGKGKKTKSKGSITISISPITYDDNNLEQLYRQISDTKGVKKTSKNFSDGKASIAIAYKENADALWQSIPKNIRSAFAMVQIDDTNIVLQPKE